MKEVKSQNEAIIQAACLFLKISRFELPTRKKTKLNSNKKNNLIDSDLLVRQIVTN